MTTLIKVTAHCASTKEVHVLLNGVLANTLQDAQSAEFVVYDDRIISVTEVVKAGQSTLAPHQQRVVDEKAELDKKFQALVDFFSTSTFASLEEAERLRLSRQSVSMNNYSGVLGERIAAFTSTGA
jgi:hypothetical protein